MDKMFAGITGVCVVLCAVMITAMVAVVSFRVVFRPPPESGQLADNQVIGEKDAWTPARTRRKPKDRLPNRAGNAEKTRRTMYVAVDEDDMMAARALEEKRMQELLDEADKLTGKKEKKSSRKKLNNFKNLSDEEKNRIWWEIESVATRYSGEEQITFTLTFGQAARISRFYNTTVYEVFRLFREGAKADWRTPEAPPLTGEETDEDGKKLVGS